jgi:hypothetical protein
MKYYPHYVTLTLLLVPLYTHSSWRGVTVTFLNLTSLINKLTIFRCCLPSRHLIIQFLGAIRQIFHTANTKIHQWMRFWASHSHLRSSHCSNAFLILSLSIILGLPQGNPSRDLSPKISYIFLFSCILYTYPDYVLFYRPNVTSSIWSVLVINFSLYSIVNFKAITYILATHIRIYRRVVAKCLFEVLFF